MYVVDVLDSCDLQTPMLANVPEADRQPGIEICENDEQPCVKVKTLGVTWKSDGDVFTFNIKMKSFFE